MEDPPAPVMSSPQSPKSCVMKESSRPPTPCKEEEVPPLQPGPCRPPPPWQCPSAWYTGTVKALHQEVEDFQRWAGGSQEEFLLRMRPVEDVRRVVAALWPRACVEVTGSLANGLFLPDSDVDLTLVGEWALSPPPL